ncbi:hypothetical protein DDB_G0289825 [Dictyostelium discoideum AX4]|uniref:Putative uncharacterized protein DDB_G0289825 n=1 Tax=Dictyostelium discoideum TaxID=44689 RepID=Y8591_DICDI|nr:hypothetical protein DDB_G0289825 [Dictyostelium discoideum AX4]Q54GY9.1 RecName: Full=Putative uncharacterized protein DDB_G0289825 [Dictyostelium discoideum]EAL62513.1 hypothetical protein DDB_G0289825 [Dictyostelium discoideum AX4]|eukprot:XP_636018.1 hypothetical protein DDB_G0289825 [Dictyostelium discoideum AX4]
METQTSFINDGPKIHSNKLNQLDFLSGNNNNNRDNYYNNKNDKNSITHFNNYNYSGHSSYDNESARLIPISGNFKNESINKQRRKVVIARIFILLCLLICLGLALMGLFHYLITNDKRLDSISILFWSGSAFLIIVLIICLLARHCGSD